MYSDVTMRQLEKIVDSLNLTFLSCELNKTYYSKPQAKAHYIRLDKGKIKQAKKDIENHISFEDFIKKYKRSSVEKDLLVVKYKGKNYNKEDKIEFSSIGFNGDYGHDIEFSGKIEVYDKLNQGSWIMNYYEGGKYMNEELTAFYFITNFNKKNISEPYAKMIQYSDCMVDTNTQIYREDAKRTGVRYENKQASKVEKFLKYINKETNKPKYDSDNLKDYWSNITKWDSLKTHVIETKLKDQEKFIKLLKEAVEEAIKLGGTGNEFEEYVGSYYSKKMELELKRGRRVVGGCSMDNAPRMHAVNIAVLSAETASWEVFLRAHLNIMNDRFERVSDGSYAYARRKTYIKELEGLDINVPDLMLGISLRIDNPSKNHYYGSINRLGRALSETKNTQEIEDKMLAMIKDSSLDDYNRIIIYYLFDNYNYYITDEEKKKENLKKLQSAVKQLPLYLSSKIKFEKD
jgi:hypothetical protein